MLAMLTRRRPVPGAPAADEDPAVAGAREAAEAAEVEAVEAAAAVSRSILASRQAKSDVYRAFRARQAREKAVRRQPDGADDPEARRLRELHEAAVTARDEARQAGEVVRRRLERARADAEAARSALDEARAAVASRALVEMVPPPPKRRECRC